MNFDVSLALYPPPPSPRFEMPLTLVSADRIRALDTRPNFDFITLTFRQTAELRLPL